MAPTPRKVVVLGSGGPSGQHVVKLLLDSGHNVTAVTRNPDGFPEEVRNNPKFKAVAGDVFSAESLAPIMAGHNAVISCLGIKDKQYYKPWAGMPNFYRPTMEACIKAMKTAGIRRLLVISAFCTESEGQPMYMVFVRAAFLKNILAEMREMELIIERNKADLDYTVARPGNLSRSIPITDKPIIALEGKQFVPASQSSVTKMGYPDIARGDVARFLVDSLNENKHIQKFVAIGT